MSASPVANVTLTDAVPDAESESVMTRLFNTLLATFAAILLGLACKRLHFVKPEEGDMKALGFYTGQIALPLLVFKTVATAKISEVEPGIVLACTLGKICVWGVTWVAAFFGYKRYRSGGQQVLTASIFAFFTVASNDFAIGFPVVDALYGSYVDMGAYIAANAVVGSLLFVPATSALFSVGKVLKGKSEPGDGEDKLDKSGDKSAADCCSTTRSLAIDLLMNPVISFTLVGLLFKVLLGWTLVPTDSGYRFPSPLHEITTLLTSSFGVSALFLTGVSLRSASISFWPMMLVLMKVVVCAYTSFFFSNFFSGTNSDSPSLKQHALHDFPFLYGTLPSSSAPLLFAMQFDPGAADLVATGILWGLLLSGPILFVTAIFLSGTQSMPRQLISKAQQSVSAVSVVSGIIIMLMVLTLRRGWGYNCPGRTLIVFYAAIALIYEASMCAFNPAVSKAGCDAYLANWWAPVRVFLGTVQNVLRLVDFSLFTMYILSWYRGRWRVRKDSGGPMKAAQILLGSFIAAFVVSLFLDPNTLLGVCAVPVARPVGGRHVLHRDFAWSIFLFLCFTALAVWGICGRAEVEEQSVAQEGSDEVDTSSAESSDESSPTNEAAKVWGCRPPVPIVQALAVYQMIVLLIQIANTFQVVVLSKIMGSFAGMLVLEMVLEHAQLIVLLGALFLDNAFVARLQESVRTRLPSLIQFWDRQRTGTLGSFGGFAGIFKSDAPEENRP